MAIYRSCSDKSTSSKRSKEGVSYEGGHVNGNEIHYIMLLFAYTAANVKKCVYATAYLTIFLKNVSIFTYYFLTFLNLRLY